MPVIIIGKQIVVCELESVLPVSRLTGFLLLVMGRAADHLLWGTLGTSAMIKRLRLNMSVTSTPATPSSSASSARLACGA